MRSRSIISPEFRQEPLQAAVHLAVAEVVEGVLSRLPRLEVSRSSQLPSEIVLRQFHGARTAQSSKERQGFTADRHRHAQTITDFFYLDTGPACGETHGWPRILKITKMTEAHQYRDSLGVRWVAPVGENKLAHFHQQGLPICPDEIIGAPRFAGFPKRSQEGALRAV